MKRPVAGPIPNYQPNGTGSDWPIKTVKINLETFQDQALLCSVHECGLERVMSGFSTRPEKVVRYLTYCNPAKKNSTRVKNKRYEYRSEVELVNVFRFQLRLKSPRQTPSDTHPRRPCSLTSETTSKDLQKTPSNSPSRVRRSSCMVIRPSTPSPAIRLRAMTPRLQKYGSAPSWRPIQSGLLFNLVLRTSYPIHAPPLLHFET